MTQKDIEKKQLMKQIENWENRKLGKYMTCEIENWENTRLEKENTTSTVCMCAWTTMTIDHVLNSSCSFPKSK